MVLGLDVAAGGLTYSLESLPALLGARDLIILKHALRASLDPDEATQKNGESEGAFIARMVHAAARYRFEAPKQPAVPSPFEGGF